MTKQILCLLTAWVTVLPLNARSGTYSVGAEADNLLSSGQPASNFGQLSAMEIAAPSAGQPRTQMALFRFDTAALQTVFDADYGAGNWVVTSVTVSLFSSFATGGVQPNNVSFNRIAAGGFEIDLLSDNNWSENGIT